MRSFWLDPYLWIHAAGLAALPIFLELCLLGLAVGSPLLPTWLELLIVAGVGIVPIAWMQWQRPFYIFSLVMVALQPTQLTDSQRRILRFFKTPQTQIVSLLVPLVLLWVLWQLYRLAPIATAINPIPSHWRIVGLLIAAIAFLGANLFAQVPASVFQVLLVNEKTFAAAEPYPADRIAQDFSIVGLKVNRLLPPLTAPPAERPAPAASTVAAQAPSLTPLERQDSEDSAISEPPTAEIEPTVEETTTEIATASISEVQTLEDSSALPSEGMESGPEDVWQDETAQSSETAAPPPMSEEPQGDVTEAYTAADAEESEPHNASPDEIDEMN